MNSLNNHLSLFGRGKYCKLLILLLLLQQILIIHAQKPPNIVFFLVDDQDLLLDSLNVMPKLQSLIGDKGATFANAYVSSPLCCPSRSSILTGQYVHNHGARNSSVGGGCNDINWQNGPEKTAFPTFLHDAGYKTFHSGKYLNTYGMDSVGGMSRIPPGWDTWIALKGNSVYYNYSLSVNGKEEIHGDNPTTDYLTNVIREKSLNFIDQLTDAEPFFMMITPPACHDPVTPEPKYKESLSTLKIPRTPNFNIANGPDKNWFVRLGEQPLADHVIEQFDEIYRNRLRTLLTVDDMVEDIVHSLERKNLMNNTYILYTSDHGFHLAHFSLSSGKMKPYEFDIKVPLMARGPGIDAGVVINAITSNVDLAPTLLDLAGVDVPVDMDGVSLKELLLFSNTSSMDNPHERSVLIEYFGNWSDELQPGCEYLGTGLFGCYPKFDCKCLDAYNCTYSCVRRLGSDVSELYCEWQDDEQFEEYYNLKNDPHELRNFVYNLTEEDHNDIANVLETLSTCSGNQCLKF